MHATQLLLLFHNFSRNVCMCSYHSLWEIKWGTLCPHFPGIMILYSSTSMISEWILLWSCSWICVTKAHLAKCTRIYTDTIKVYTWYLWCKSQFSNSLKSFSFVQRNIEAYDSLTIQRPENAEGKLKLPSYFSVRKLV